MNTIALQKLTLDWPNLKKFTNLNFAMLAIILKMEVPDEIAIDKAKINLRRRLTLRFVMCVPRNSGAG